MTISFLLAMDRNRAIGRDNELPWRLPADLKFVKELTMGHTLLMGRKTYESIGRPLPGRRNVILTQRPDYRPEGCEVVHSVHEALSRYGQEEELFIFGGGEIFRLFLPYVTRMHITLIDYEFEADTFFPEMDMTSWELVSSVQGITDEKNPYTYYFQRYEKQAAGFTDAKYYAVLLPMKDEEKSKLYRSEHLAYLEARRSEGRIFANGRFVDGAGGLVIYRAETLEEARSLVENDPYVARGARSYQIHEWDMVVS